MLSVWYEKQLVGKIWCDSTNKMGFEYNSNWLKSGFAISQQLPLAKKTFPPETNHAQIFFANLLPEAGAREHIVRDLKIADSDFVLLRALGAECAGALTILPEAQEPNSQNTYIEITDDKLKQLLESKGRYINLIDSESPPRLSLAGAQDKCAIYYDNKNYFLPEGTSPSTHILKFELADYKNIPVYEYITTQLAKSLGLPVIDLSLKKFEKYYYLLIDRYDRKIVSENKIKRLHQEDACQALGFSYARKYQDPDGPRFEDCYELIQTISKKPILDSENLLRWQIFNILVGNSDGHAKNISIIYDEKNQIRLAPFYDLVCTRAIAHISIKLGFSVGNLFDPTQVAKKHWVVMAEGCQIKSDYLINLVKKMAQDINMHWTTVLENFLKQFGEYPALNRITKIIETQAHRILKQL